MKLSVRLLLVVFFFLISLFVLRPVAFAQSATQAQPYLSANTDSDVPRNLHTWTQTVLIEVIAASSCAITGIDPTNPNQACLGIDQKSGKIGYIQNGGGAIGMLTSSLSYLYTPPIHTGDYLSYLSHSFGLTKVSYAAGTTGTGFDQLKPIINIWIAFRNITYLFFIIIFLVIGVAIMLRVRIDPRTVMTIQNQIPKIIIGVVMVTFSFAISGFLIDMMWTSMYVSYGILSNVKTQTNTTVDLTGLDPTSMQMNTPLGIVNTINTINYQDSTTNGKEIEGIAGISSNISIALKGSIQSSLGIVTCPDPLTCLSQFFNPLNIVLDVGNHNIVSTVFDIISFVAGGSMFYHLATLTATEVSTIPVIGAFFSTTIGNGASFLAGEAVYATTQYILREVLPWLIIFLVVYIAIFMALIRLWFELLKAFLFVLFDIIFAPFWIMAGLIPGNTTINVGSWLKDLVANLAVFPATAAMFMLGKILMDAFASNKSGIQFVPPLVGNPGDTNFLGAIIGLAVILSTPQVVTMVKKALKAPNIGLGGVGQAISTGVAIPMAGVKGVGKFYVKTPAMDKRGGFGALIRGFTG